MSSFRGGATGYDGRVTRPDTATKHAADVSAMFDEVSPRYDLINDVLTVGNDRLWRIATTRAVAPRKGMRILDLAAGTGTSSAAFAAHGAHVTAADFSEGMLAEGRKRHAGNDLIDFVWADGTDLPFEDDTFDAATISYGLRNISDPKRALAEMTRVVKPGGRVVVAEFSTPPSPIVRGPYALYGRYVLPLVAGAINREAAGAYKYLNESIEAWPDQDELARWMREAGLERVAYRNLTFGIVALHRGFVPKAAAAKADAPAAGAAQDPGAKDPAAQPAGKPAADTASEPESADAPKHAAEGAAATPATEPKPAAQKPAAQKPAAAKKPAAKKPATPAAPSPAAKKPAAKKSAPAAQTPTAMKPAVEEPASEASAGSSQSAKQDPAAAGKPGAPKPAAAKQSAASKPAAAKPSAQKRPAAPKKPAAPKPAAPKPAAAKPAAPKPAGPKSGDTK